jgi:hypothetical protein
MTRERILEQAHLLAQGEIGLGQVLGIPVEQVVALARVAGGLKAAGRDADAAVFLDGLLALYPKEPRLLVLRRVVQPDG